MTFGERLREMRLLKGLTQEQLAKQIGVAKSTLTGYEKGNREPDVFKIKRILEVLEIDSDYLLGVSREPKQKSFIENELLDSFNMLNDEGQKKALETVSDLTQIPKYQKRTEIKNIRLNKQTDDNEITLTVAARGGGVTTVKTTKEALDELTSLEPEDDIDL